MKLLTAAAIFVPPFLVPMLVASTALAGGVLAIVFIIGRRLAARPISPRPRAVLDAFCGASNGACIAAALFRTRPQLQLVA